MTPLLEGHDFPFGARPRDGGVNFAVWSEHASRIELCIYDPDGEHELHRHALFGPHDGVFHGFLPGAGAGVVYAFRAHGPWQPEQGHRFDATLALLDPYAQEIVATRHGLRSRVAAPAHAEVGEGAPIDADDLVLYEVHVKGFSQQHPQIPPELRGRYAALAHPAAIAHFKSLGVTTLSLLPVQHHLDEPHLVQRAMVNYWGYNTLGFFAADPRFAGSADPREANAEFRAMVDTLHAHGLEVVLDVVYNHTPEGDEHGACYSFRGLDNASWYRLDSAGRSENLTGCGNTVKVSHPRVAQFVLDSLRHWVQVMGVDGFRFDLAPVLGRSRAGAFDAHAAFFQVLRQDPVLSTVHLIAEPWDAAPDGYQVGRFPGRWLEWNDRFRDGVRGWWLRSGVNRGELARRFAASSDLFHHSQRRPSASINFLSVHDGFTLADTVSYSRKHNHANGEGNRDGRDNELCANLGAEGPTTDAAILEARRRLRRAMLATLALSQGTPMLCAGDEFGNSQQGNNNAYNQDNPTGWLSWEAADREQQAFVAEALALRRDEPLLRHDRWFGCDPGHPQLRWFSPQGHELHGHDWQDSGAFAGVISTADDAAHVLVAFNPEPEPRDFVLPPRAWRVALDSAGELAAGSPLLGGAPLRVPARALVVLRDRSASSTTETP